LKISKKRNSCDGWSGRVAVFEKITEKFFALHSGQAQSCVPNPPDRDSVDLQKMECRGSHVWPKLFVQNFKKACDAPQSEPFFSAGVVIWHLASPKRRFLLEISR
jgi:hypothetical protein